MPVMRPLWAHDDDVGQPVQDNENTWLLGRDLFIQPIMDQGVTWVRSAVPAYATWYDVENRVKIVAGVGITAPISFLPVFQRGG